MSEIAKEIINIFRLVNNNITPSNSMLKEKLDDGLKGISSPISFWIVDEFIKRSSNTKKASTIKEYIYTINCFEKYIKERIEWDTIDMSSMTPI